MIFMINEFTRDSLLYFGLASGTFSTMMLASQLHQWALYWMSFLAIIIFADFAVANVIIGLFPYLTNRARLNSQISRDIPKIKATLA